MDPQTQFCPNNACPARGKSGKGNIVLHSRKEARYKCTACGKTFAATSGTPFYRLRHSLDLVTCVVTLITFGCPLQAIVVAFGLDERTVMDWQERAGKHAQQVHEHLVEQPRDLEQVQADEIRVKAQGKALWLAMAMMVRTRLWLGAAVSQRRDERLLRALFQHVRAAALARPLLVVTDGLQAYFAVIDRARRLATVKTSDREIVLREVPVGDSPYNLLQQVNTALAQSCQPFVAWRLEWVSSEINRLWPESFPQIRNEHGSAYVTGYAHDEAGNLVYLGMVGHKTVLESIRASIQARQRMKLFLQGRPIYPLATHYCQTWQHLPDYGAYHAALIADPALPGKWQPGEEVVYILVLEGDLAEVENPEDHASQTLSPRLSETLPIPIMDHWDDALWMGGVQKEMICKLTASGDCLAGYCVHVSEKGWVNTLTWLLKEQKIRIS